MSGIQSKADVRDGIRRRTRNTKDIKGLVFFNEVLKKIEESRRLGAAGRRRGGVGEGRGRGVLLQWQMFCRSHYAHLIARCGRPETPT